MIRIYFDRDSVCMADDIESHAISFDVDEQISIDDFISILYVKQNAIARIGGGNATWILQLKTDSIYKDIAVFTEQCDTARYFFNLFNTIGEMVIYFSSVDFYTKYLAQKDPEIVYNTMIAEKKILIDPIVEIKEKVLREKYKLFMEFYNEIERQKQKFEWNYCEDGKFLLGNIVNKKKKICWFSVWNTGFKLVFYFTEKTINGVYQLDINNDIKRIARETKPAGKLISVIIEVENKDKMKDGLKILEYIRKI